MSNGEVTRLRILAAARGLLEEGAVEISMAQIARAAGVTRQLLYHHFDNRASLLLEMSREVDRRERPVREQELVDRAADPVRALEEAIALQGRIKPRIAAVADAVDRLRRTDVGAEQAWEERENARLGRARTLIDRLADVGVLDDVWDVEVAARLLWSMTSQQAWRMLVGEGDWSREAWVEHTTRAVKGALLRPDRDQRR